MEAATERHALNIDLVWNWSIDQLRRGHGESHVTITKNIIDTIGHAGMVDIAQRYRNTIKQTAYVFFDKTSNMVTFQPMPEFNINSPSLGELLYIAKYEPVVSATSSPSDSDSIESSHPSRNLNTRGSKHRMAKVPRPMNHFILYRQYHHHQVVANHPGIHNNEISKILGKKWRAEDATVKQFWKEKAFEVKLKHAHDHPDYSYNPTKASSKARRASAKKGSKKAASSNFGAAKEVGQPSALQLADLTPSFTPHGNFFSHVTDPHKIGAFEQMMEKHNASRVNGPPFGARGMNTGIVMVGPGPIALQQQAEEDALHPRRELPDLFSKESMARGNDLSRRHAQWIDGLSSDPSANATPAHSVSADVHQTLPSEWTSDARLAQVLGDFNNSHDSVAVDNAFQTPLQSPTMNLLQESIVMPALDVAAPAITPAMFHGGNVNVAPHAIDLGMPSTGFDMPSTGFDMPSGGFDMPSTGFDMPNGGFDSGNDMFFYNDFPGAANMNNDDYWSETFNQNLHNE